MTLYVNGPLAFVTPSVTTFTGMNPSYTIYTVDGPGDEASYVSYS